MAIQNIDLARIYSAGEQIKGLRQQNALAPIQAENAQLQNNLLRTKLDAFNQPKPVDRADLLAAAKWADTPEKWQQAIAFYEKEGVDGISKYRDAFPMRDQIIGMLSQPEEPGKGFTLGEGQRRYDAAGNLVAEAPKGKGGPFEGTAIDAQTYNILLQGNPSSPEYALAYWRATQPRLVQTPEGLVPIQPQALPPSIRRPVNPIQNGQPTGGGQEGQPIPGTAPKQDLNQTNAATFADRMQQASGEIRDIISQGYDPANAKDAAARATPIIGNYAVSDLGQRYQQAAENWVTANLRRESGAAIPPEELAQEVRKYFPNPGDSPAVVEQKRRARETVEQGMIRAAGPLYKQPPAPAQPADTGTPAPDKSKATETKVMDGTTYYKIDGQWYK